MAPQHPSPFNWATIVQMATIPLLTVAFYFTVNWAVTGDTLKRHDVEIAEEKIEREKLKASEDEKREALRKQLAEYADRTTQSVAALAQHAAVQDEKVGNINENLNKVVNSLQNLQYIITTTRDKRSERQNDSADWSAMTGRELTPH
jgi:hypothetical protein